MVHTMETQIQLPAGFSAHPMNFDYAQQVVDLFNEYTLHHVGTKMDSVESMMWEWRAPGFNVETDTMIVFDEQGNPVAYGDVYDTSTLHVNVFTYGLVKPSLSGKGIGSALLKWEEERARKNVSLAAKDARVMMVQYIFSTHQEAATLLRANGFEHVRTSLQMRIDMDEQPEYQPIDGIVIRPIHWETEFRKLAAAVHESFQDHWGFAREPIEEYTKRWETSLINEPDFDPSLCLAAFEGDEIVGACVNHPKTEEDPAQGWIGTLGVRRQWRRRGVAMALLKYSFAEFYRRGQRKAGLTVDSQSLTGATRLYERAGMRLARAYDRYEKELRPGVDIRTESVE